MIVFYDRSVFFLGILVICKNKDVTKIFANSECTEKKLKPDLKTIIYYLLVIIYYLCYFLFTHICISHGNTSHYMPREFFKSFFCYGIISCHNRRTLVTPFTNTLHQWYLAQKWYIIFFRQSFSAFFPKNVIPVSGQFSRNEITHIFNETQDWYIQLCLAKHCNCFFCIGQCNILWCGYDNSTSQRNGLH